MEMFSVDDKMNVSIAEWQVAVVIGCIVFSTQSTFTRCRSALNISNVCIVDDPFSISTDGVMIIKVNGSNVVARTTTGNHHIQLHDIGQWSCV